MSDGDSFLARWSRRKEQMRRVEQDEAEIASASAEARPEGEPAAIERNDDNAPPDEPLPRIEDVTAESDVTAFLRKGVPEALKKAALRKAWSLDPLIRDFASPAEYDWDFNAAGSMAGFGPIGAGHTAEKLLATAKAMQSGPLSLDQADEQPGQAATSMLPNQNIEPSKVEVAGRLSTQPAASEKRTPVAASRPAAKVAETDETAAPSAVAADNAPDTRPIRRHGGAAPE